MHKRRLMLVVGVTALIVWLALVSELANPLAANESAAVEPTAMLVVAHPDVAVSGLTRQACSAMFLKEQRHWDNGLVVTPIDLVPGDPAREAFSLAIHERSVAAIKRYWQRMLFSGRATPPVEKATEAELIAMVRSTPGAIGYVDARADLAGLKVLRIAE